MRQIGIEGYFALAFNKHSPLYFAIYQGARGATLVYIIGYAIVFIIMKPHTLLLYTLIMLSANANAQDGWGLDKDEDGILVYTKDEEGSKYRSFKGIVSVTASEKDVFDVLINADNYTQWYGYTKTSKLLKQVKNEQFNYVETHFPWPFKNRDMVYKITIDTSNAKGTVIHLMGLPDYIPRKKGIVRMDKAEGYILLESFGEQTRVTYVFHSEPGGGIPAQLANRSISELPYTTLLGLRTMLEKNNPREVKNGS